MSSERCSAPHFGANEGHSVIHRADIEARMRALLAGHGCLDAAAEALNARWGTGVQKGTLSRRANGELPWTILDVIGLEDALGRYPVTRMMARRMRSLEPVDVIAASQAVAKEAGEAVAALMGAALSATPAQRAQALAEIDEALEAMRMARAALEASVPRTAAKVEDAP